MSKFESVAVPFQTLPDGRKILTDKQVFEMPELGDFIARFPDHFERSEVGQYWIFRE